MTRRRSYSLRCRTCQSRRQRAREHGRRWPVCPVWSASPRDPLRCHWQSFSLSGADVAKHHEGRWDKTDLQLESTDFNQAERVSEARKTSQEMRRLHQFTPTTDQIPQRRQRRHERHDLAHHGTRWLEMGLHGKRLDSSRLKQPIPRPPPTQRQPDQHNSDKQCTPPTTTTTTRPTLLGQTMHTTKAHDHDGGGAEDDDTLLILPQVSGI